MYILISDYKEQMEPDYTMTTDVILKAAPEAQIAIEPYGTPAFYEALDKADGLITAFIPVDEALIEKAPHLQCVSQNAAGYSNVDTEALRKRGIELRYIKEYCTREVAEHAISMMLALNHSFKKYENRMEKYHEWQYQKVAPCRTVNRQTLAIFGLGKIGKMTASLGKALGMHVIAVDPFITKEQALTAGVTLVSRETALAQADVIINHMALTQENYHYFDEEAFAKMKQQPIFINVGRGGCVEEDALLHALDKGIVRAAGLDVLEAENPDMEKCSFLHRDNVILTPHCAFYSEESIKALHEISAGNLMEVLTRNS